MVYKIGCYKCKFLIENIIKKLIIILFICNTFVLLSVTNAVSSEQTNVKNINLSKNAKTFDQTRKMRNKLYSDIMKTGFTTESEMGNLMLVYNTHLGELHKNYPGLTITEIKKECSNLPKMQNKIKKELKKSNNALWNARIDLNDARYRVEDGIIIFTPIYKHLLNEKQEVFDKLQRQNDKLKQEEKEVDRKYKDYKENDYKRLLLLEKIEAFNHVENKFEQQVKSVKNDPFKAYIIKEKCLDIRSPKYKAKCQYDVITELLDMDGRSGYFNNKLSNNELKEKEKFKLKYEVRQEILGGVNLSTFGNSQSSYDPIKNYMNARCNNITDILDKEICKSNFIDKFIEIGKIEFSKDGKLVVHDIEKLDGFMKMSESVEVNNNNDKQYTVSEQNNILVKQGIIKVNDNGAVTYIDRDMLKKFVIERGFKLSGEYATEETSTKEMINELKEVKKNNNNEMRELIEEYSNNSNNDNTLLSTTSIENIQNPTQEIVNNIEDTKSSTQNSIEINNNDNNDNNVIITQNPMTKADTQTVMLDNNIKNQQEEITVKVESAEETTEEPTTFSSPRTMMKSAAPKRTVVNDLSASQKAQNAMLSSINNNVNRVRHTNNKNLNNSIYNSIKDNVINDGNNAGSINDSMWYSINTDMLSNRDDKTKSSSGSVLINFGYNFNYIDNIDSSITVSFNQTKSNIKTYSKDIPVNTYNFALSLFNKYNFGNDIVLSGMLSYNHNIVKDGNTKNIQYGYVDGDDYITSNFTKQTNKKHYNDISLSVSALYNKVILDNVKLSSGFDINYFTTNKFHNALTLSPVMELGSVNGMYNNLLFPVVYVKYNTNINNKNININNGSNNKVKLDKSNAEYGVKTKINLPNKLNCVLSYSNDSNRNNNFGANVNINF